jgi:hypothetical protein
MEDNIEEAQEMLDSTLEALQTEADAGNYQHVELRLVDNEGNVKIKGTMSVANMMAIEKMQSIDKGETMKMFYFALEDDLNNAKDDK